MAAVLFLLALAMVAGGGSAAFFGSDILLADRGLPMVLAGATVAAAGTLLLGFSFVVHAIRRVEREIVGVRDRLSDLRAANLAATARPPRPETSDPTTLSPALPEVTEDGSALIVPSEPRAEPALALMRPAEVAVVGRYASGGNSYTMFSDGSILADTPSGQHRFNSLDELKAFVSNGGERR